MMRIFGRAAQPRCAECRRTQSKCSLLKKENYRFWLYAHARLRNEKYNVKKVTTSYIAFEDLPQTSYPTKKEQSNN
jgi:hypothetical protein